MKIAIMGPADSIERVLKLAGPVDKDVQLLPYHAFSLSDSSTLFSQCQREVDGILFTGRGVYDSVASTQHIDIPWTFVPHNETGLYELLATHDLSAYQCASVDYMDYDTVKVCMRSSPISEFFVSPRDGIKTEKEYAAIHRKVFSEHKGVVVLTAFSPIVRQMQAEGIPVIRIYTTSESIRNKLSDLILTIRNQQMDNSKIAVQIIALQVGTERMTKTSSMEDFLAFETRLVPYLKMIAGAVFNYGRNEYIVFSTKGLIKKTEAQIAFFNLMKSSHAKVFSGIGMGSTAMLAELNANRAMEYSLKESTNSFYIMYENQIIDGPILESRFISRPTANIDHQLDEIVRTTGVSAAYLQKLDGLMRANQKDSFTADEMAELLNISKRSARRILKQLVDHRYATVSGTKCNAGAGRPQNIIYIHLNL